MNANIKDFQSTRTLDKLLEVSPQPDYRSKGQRVSANLIKPGGL